MKHHAKAPAAGSTQATGNSRGLLRRALATRAAFGRFKGSGAPAAKLLGLLAISLIALFATAAPASADSAEVVAVKNISYASADVTGKVQHDGFGTFQFQTCISECTEPGATWSDAGGGFLIGSGSSEVEAHPNQRKGGTTYFVRLTTSAGAISPPPYLSFTTLVADPPAVEQTDNATEVSYTTAKVTGKVNRPVKSNDLDCHFQYITDEQFTNNPPGEEFTGAAEVPCVPNPVSAPGSSEVEAHLTGLANATTYHLRLKVSAAGGEDAKEAPSTFTTLTVDPPSVKSIENAAEVEYTRAQVKGVVERPDNADPAFDVTCNFEYVTDQQFNENPPGEEFTGAAQVPCETETEPPENPITVAGESPVKATLTGLLASTTYHLRLRASNQGGSDAKEAAATFATQGPVPKPTVLKANDATEVEIFSAHASGEVERPAGTDAAALDTSCRFEYITDQLFDENEANSVPGFEGATIEYCAEAPPWIPITTTDPTPVSAELTGLKPATTYHLRLVAENNLGGNVETKEAAHTFTTKAPELPTVTIDPVAGGTFTTAHVSGTVTLADGHIEAQSALVQVSSDGGSTWSSGSGMLWTHGEFERKQGTLLGGEGLYVLEADFTGLQPSTTYAFRIIDTYSVFNYPEAEARGEVGFSPEPNPEITTEPLFPPTAKDLAVTEITGTSAHFSATVDPHAPAGPLSDAAKKAFATDWHFECTPACKDANENVIGGTIQAEGGAQTVAGDAKRLDPNTHYAVTLVIHSEGGGDPLGPVPFDTPLIKPTVKAAPGGSDGKGGYILQGVVNPNGSPVSDCIFAYGPNSGLEAKNYAFQASCSPAPGAGAKPITVEAPLTGLTLGATYHFRIFATNAAGTEKTEDQIFVPVPAAKENCPSNEQIRVENNSLALPECRAYEMVTPPGKEGANASFEAFDGGDRVLYASGAGNIAHSGVGSFRNNKYVANRTTAGWETIPNLNGSSGSIYDAPSEVDSANPTPNFYSEDLLTSIWTIHRRGDPTGKYFYLRGPDGTFALIGSANALPGDNPGGGFIEATRASADLSHLVAGSYLHGDASNQSTQWGPGVYEFLGTGNDVPRRVDLDNLGDPVSSCDSKASGFGPIAALDRGISPDGRVVFFTVSGGCGGANPPTEELWARVNGTTSFDVSASQCDRIAADPGGLCNDPSRATFAAAANDGSRVFFMTAQQLVDGDTDQTNDLYACDIPVANPAPIGKANSCASLTEVSGASPEAEVDPPAYAFQGPVFLANPGLVSVAGDGSTAYFYAQGVLADNKDALGEKALAGDHNFYAWRTDANHPDGQTTFVGRLPENGVDLGSGQKTVADLRDGQTTPDGRYLVFTTATQLVPTDTDTARDVYRYDSDTGVLTRVSTNVFGVAGNGDGFDAKIGGDSAISDDGQKIVFTTIEALSPADGNGEFDVYLWTPDRVSLVSTGAAGGGATEAESSARPSRVAIDGSGKDIYFGTRGALAPADGDDSFDVYDARIGGGFSFAQAAPCSGEACQPPGSGPPAPPAAPANRPKPDDNVKPKTCPKGKVRKHGKCVKRNKSKPKKNKKHNARNTHASGKAGR